MASTHSRRRFLLATGLASLARLAPAYGQTSTTPSAGPQASSATPHTYRFFNAAEAAFMEAAVNRLIPPDDVGPSAMEAGVVDYIDGQLAGAWGSGERLYRNGPWQMGTPSQGYQLPLTPAELFRTALRTINEELTRQGSGGLGGMAPEAQDAYLTDLENGKRDLGGVPSKVFFETLLEMTVQGYFSDPVYGGNKGMAAWEMIGFPGAYADYYNWVDRHNERFPGKPTSLAETGSGHVRVAPYIPAYAPVRSNK